MNDHLEMQNPFAESFEYIASFFFGDVELIETFNAVCEDMLSIDNELMIRHDASIIGMAKGNQCYRFYLKYIDGQYYIKYKHELKSYLLA